MKYYIIRLAKNIMDRFEALFIKQDKIQQIHDIKNQVTENVMGADSMNKQLVKIARQTRAYKIALATGGGKRGLHAII